MRKTTNKILSALIAASLVFGMVTTASAASEGDTAPTAASVQETVETSAEDQQEPAAEETVTEEPAAEESEEQKEEAPAAAEEEKAEEQKEEAPAEEAPAEEIAPAEEAAPAEEVAPAEEEAVETVSEPEEETVAAMPAQTFSKTVKEKVKGKQKTLVTVEVSAPEGAFPEGTTMKVVKVGENDKIGGKRKGKTYRQAIESVTEGDVETILAVDITFACEGEEIEPAKEITVSFKSDKLTSDEDRTLTIVHIADDGKAEEMDAVIDESSKEAVFDAESFSVYAVVETGAVDDRSRVTINFYGLDTTNPIATYYVKNGDSDEEIKKIVTDPGAGQLAEGLLFRGWSVDDLKDADGNYYSDTEDYVGAGYNTKTTPKTIDGIRKHLRNVIIKSSGDGIHEGDVLNIYAIVFKYYNVSYFGDHVTGEPNWTVSLGTDTVLLRTDEEQAEYTVSMAYSATSNQNFKGWETTQERGGGNITGWEEGKIYPNDTKITITGDVTFNVVAPHGFWLVYNGNGKGASYNAPEFYLPNENTVRPATAEDGQMKRNGYQFKGWYEAEYDNDGNPVFDDGQPVLQDNQFEFNHPLTKNTYIYAKWEPNTTAPYTIILWKQNGDRSAYEVAGSYVSQGPVGDPIPFDFVNNTDEDYVTGVGSNGHYTGFTLNHSETDTLGSLQKTTSYDGDGNPVKENVDIPKITPEGDAVLNLYYDRIVYNLRFYMYRRTGGTYSYATRSNAGRNVWNIATGWTTVTENNLPTLGNAPGSNSPRYTIQETTSTVDNYYGSYFTLSAYYGEDISSKWPTYDEIKGPNNDGTKAVSFIMMNGTGLKGNAYNGNGYGDGRDTIKGVITVMDYNILGLTNDANGNFLIIRYASFNDWTYHIYYETIPGETYDNTVTRTINGVTKTYYLDHDVKSRSSNTYPAQQNPPQYEGFTVAQNADGSEFYDGYGGNAPNQGNITGYTVYLNYYYNREIYNITYMDGVYFDGSNNIIQTRAAELLETNDEQIIQGAAISDQYKNYKPDLPAGEQGYVFEGWYIDEGCKYPYEFTTMPVGGIVVHAKWRQVQYRVFLHPNAEIEQDDGPTVIDESLSWGDELSSPTDKVQMCFRVSWGDKISLPYGTRNKYEFIGWFKEGGKVYMSGTDMNDTNVPAEPVYNKETDMTDVIDKFGNVVAKGQTYWISNTQLTNTVDPYNADVERDWVSRKLDLYGKWRQIIEGAEGIKVQYIVGDKGKDGTEPNDSLLYKDEAGAIAQEACVVGDEYAEEWQFLYWVVQKWDEQSKAYVDTNVNVFPGDSFTVQLEAAFWDIHESHVDPQTGETVIDDADYTMQLRAEYGPKETPKDTFFNFYRNWDENDTAETGLLHKEEGLQINEARDIYTLKEGIPKRDGYRFLGWARETEKLTANGDPITYYPGLKEDDLHIRWIEASNGVEAHYEAKNKEGNWVKVTQTAADDLTPYQAWYAVWQANYYVYYSGSGKVYAYDLEDTVNLQAHSTDGTLYGGYSFAYGGYTIKVADKEEASKARENGYQISTTENTTAIYNPDKTYVKGLTKWWNTMGTTPYGQLKPEAGVVYYVKEVPNKYLTTRIQYIYDWSQDYKINQIYMMTVVDDKLYNEVFFNLEITATSKNTATLVGSFTFEQGNSTVKVTTKPTDYSGVKRGWIGYADGGFATTDGFIAPNTEFKITPGWTTKDGVTVTGSARRFTTGADGNKSTIKELTE